MAMPLRLIWAYAAVMMLVLAELANAYVIQQQYRPVQQPVQQNQIRTGYYPMRVNCPTNRCNQNRYRWNVRPVPVPVPVNNNCNRCRTITPTVINTGTNNGGQPNGVINVGPNIRVYPGGPGVRIITPAPPQPLPVAPTEAPIQPQPTVPQTLATVDYTTSFTLSPAPSPSPSPSPTPEVSTAAPEVKSITSVPVESTTSVEFITPVTPEPTAATTEAATTTSNNQGTTAAGGNTELPTPAPFTDDAVQQQSSAMYMRPTKRPSDNANNPCPTEKPLKNEFNTAVSCNYVLQPNGGCPEDYWCHTGSTFATTACCPSTNSTSKCDLARASGIGEALVPRWYFDSATKQCKRFLYKGLKGNANNFITYTQCSEACEREKIVIDIENPCRHGLPFRNGTKKLKCGPMKSGNVCPKDHYCHIGETPAQTACCQGSGIDDTCMLSLNIGAGRSLIKRFYYNNVAKRCIEFVYKGTKGNENNFLTYNDCKDACMRWSNPCPVLFDYGEKKECNSDFSCDTGEWCHIGASKESTSCCPGAIANPCKQPLETGVGSDNLTRWYADTNDKSCKRECKSFTYKGTKGNQNNFLSKEACEERCRPECNNPCSSGSMLLEPTGEPRACGPVSPCPSNYWCHVGASPESTVCCSAVKNPCELPKIEGKGDVKSTRYYFDQKAHKCLAFIYFGTGGNQNNFLTHEECRDACPSYENPCGHGQPLLVNNTPKVCSPSERCPGTHFCHIGVEDLPNYCCPKNGDPCIHLMSTGFGTAIIKRFFFDQESKRCREFVYHGAKGNANNFLSQEDCELVCPVLPNPCANGDPLLDPLKEPIICSGSETCPSGYFCHVGGAPETTNCCPGTRRPCDLTVEIGEGLEDLDRWYYDGSVQMCQKFKYRGRRGNANNFLSREMCQEQCHELNPCLHGEPLIDANGERMLCTGGQKLDSCPKSHYCHVGSTAITTICCPRGDAEVCEQPMNTGVGGEGLPRWYFDTGANKCTNFVYGGSKGNENNFISKVTCEELCPEHRSYCPHGMPLLDAKSNKPVTCGINHGCPTGHICHMSAEFSVSICCEDPADFCLQPREAGPCTNTEIRFGYHPLTDSCVPYEYGGCDGTLNNFKTLERCTEICCKEFKFEDAAEAPAVASPKRIPFFGPVGP